MELRELIALLRKRWLSLVCFVILGLLVAGAYTLTLPKQYTASAQLFVSTTQAEGTTAVNNAQFAAQRVKSYAEIVTSPEVLQPVISELNLPYTAQQLAGMVSASNPALTVLLDVTATDPMPLRAAAIANATAVELGRVIENLETPNAQAIAPIKVSLTDPAEPPGSPSSPRTRINLILGALVGLVIGLGWALIRKALDNTITSPLEIDKLTSAPTLGAVLFDANAKSQVLSALDSKSIDSEGYRTIRTNLQYINVDDPIHAFVVTSAAPGDGKTTVACNLAIALAQSGKKVCLVEADLRRPRVSEYLQLNSGAGLTEVLAGQVTLDAALQVWGNGMFQVLPPGAIPPNPSELLGSHQMAQIIGNLKREFDVVILDTPPLLAVSDAAVLASQADGAVVVVRHGKSSRDAVRNAVASLEQINAKILGTVLNAIPAKRGGAYGYGYGYGYDSDSKGKPQTSSPVAEVPPASTGTGRSDA